MTQSPSNDDTQIANFVGIFLVLTLVFIFFLIANTNDTSEADSTVGQTVAQVAPTDTPQQPIETSEPPTPTAPPPTATPELSAPTTQPTAEDGQGETDDGASTIDSTLVSEGETLFVLCAACHGSDARGLPNLGKDLVESEFVASQTDTELVQFITTGRPLWDPLNTTGIDMPPKGGNPAMTTEDIEAIVAYIRSLSGDGEAESGGASDDTNDTTSAGYDPALVGEGEVLFAQCAACHGPDARGLPNLGKNLVESEFVAGINDDELLAFIKTGRPLWDAANTTGIDMPPKGGNPAMTDEDIQAIIAFIRTLPNPNE